MRIDHHAYRKATKVAGTGFLGQAAIALTVLVFGQVALDTAMRLASLYLFGGLFVWLSLIVVFYQHTQERLEALEEDELAAARAGGTGSVFQAAREEVKPAARRLHLMHKWLMPCVSLFMAAYLGFGAWMIVRSLGLLGDQAAVGEFLWTPRRGWALAICLMFSALSFVFSRFVAGMAEQTAWQNLRGGAGYMVGTALVLLAISIGVVFRFLDNEQVILWVTYAIPVFMLLLAVEIGIHFILNLYRPRIPGEVPRPAFDSRVLGLLAAPESIVRSLNEAVNYQFGFDVTSSWGYQLLLRSVGWLVAFGAVVLVALNMMVVVEPHQQAVKLSGGALVGEPGTQVHTSGIMWKLPWPFQAAAVYDVSRVRELPLTARRLEDPDVQLWSREINTDATLDPFLVGGSERGTGEASFIAPVLKAAAAGDEGSKAGFDPLEGLPMSDRGVVAAEPVTGLFALVDAEISLQYRIKPEGLLDFLLFTSDQPRRRQRLNMREAALKALALREVTQHLSRLSLEQVVTHGRGDVLGQLRENIQATFDRHATGVEVVAVNAPMLRPSGDVSKNFENFAMAKQQRQEMVAAAGGELARTLSFWIGDRERGNEALAEIDKWQTLQRDLGSDAKEVIDQRLLVERLFAEAGGQLARDLDAAEAQRWIKLMEARAQAKQFLGRLAAYRAAPSLFKKREMMILISQMMATRRKFILIGIDPDRVSLDVDLQEPSSLFSLPNEGESEP